MDLTGVIAFGPADAWAVGYVGDTDGIHTLIQHWDGASWTIVPSPNQSESGVGSNLLGVAAASSTHVWAVGDIDTGEYVMGTLTEQWDGASWRAVASPTVQEGALLGKVAVDGSGAAWAVGWRQVGGLSQPPAMRWTGTQWLIADASSFDGVTADFAGVAVLGPDEVWGVGGRDTRTLAAHWDGTSWTVTSSANPGRAANTLIDVAEVPGTSCLWAVGSYVNRQPTALVERHCEQAGPG